MPAAVRIPWSVWRLSAAVIRRIQTIPSAVMKEESTGGHIFTATWRNRRTTFTSTLQPWLEGECKYAAAINVQANIWLLIRRTYWPGLAWAVYGWQRENRDLLPAVIGSLLTVPQVDSSGRSNLLFQYSSWWVTFRGQSSTFLDLTDNRL